MADVASSLADWSTTASSNLPNDNTVIGAGLADNLQQIQATVRAGLAFKGADIASGSTVDLSTATGNRIDVTHTSGTTAISSLGTVSAGIWKIVKFVVSAGTLTLTHNSTSLILPGGANITVANGDIAYFTSLGSGNWECNFYQRANGKLLVLIEAADLAANAVTTDKVKDGAITTEKVQDGAITTEKVQDGAITAAKFAAGAAATESTAGVLAIATQADMKAGSSTAVAVTPGRQHYHPSAAKAWVNWNCVDASIRRSYNVSSITDNGVGDFTINFSTPFLSADYALAGFANFNTVNPAGLITYNNTFAPQVNSCRIRVVSSTSAGGIDSSHATVLFFGEM